MAIVTDTNCPAGVWTKVVTAMTVGRLAVTNAAPSGYYVASVATGAGAPSVLSDGQRLPETSISVYEGPDSLDFYVWPVGSAGDIRVTKES